MLSFFRSKKQPPILPLEGPWAVMQGMKEGMPLVVRAHEGYKRFAPLEGFAFVARVRVMIRNPLASGRPTGEENFELLNVEDALQERLEKSGEAVLVTIVTGCNEKEFVFYARDLQLAEERVNAVTSAVQACKFQFMGEEDRRWRYYFGFFE